MWGYLIGVFLALFSPAKAAEDWAQRTVIVCNDNEPESYPLALEYAALRQIPTNRIFRLQVRVAETITRREFNRDLRAPLVEFLAAAGLLRQVPVIRDDPELGQVPALETVENRVGLLVLMYGVPLRIESDPSVAERAAVKLPKEMQRNEASVDSELAVLPATGVPVTGPARNPFFRVGGAGWNGTLQRQMILVGRLDGPSPAVVRRMMADAVAVEKTGLLGRVYCDARGLREGGYVEGDNWIRSVAEQFRAAGYESELDERPEVLGAGAPVSDMAVYAGWYAGQATGVFTNAGFALRRGTVAVHIHSASAASLRTRVAYWAGPLLDRGAAATTGNVFEPYLVLTPWLNEFYRRLLAGQTFIEAGWGSVPVVSWQTVFVGDPLYRPFALGADEQVAKLMQTGHADLEWAYLRLANLQALEGNLVGAAKVCQEQGHRLQSVVLQERLGDLWHAAGRTEAARELWSQLAKVTVDSGRKARLLRKATP